ncbi:MAG: arginase family protein [Deinococcales bacterium]
MIPAAARSGARRRRPAWDASAYREARARGNLVLTREQMRDPAHWGRALEAVAGMERCYVTLDMDGFDPSIAPGVSSPEPGGFAYPEVRRLLQQVAERTEIIAFDVMETNPLVDPNGATAYLAAVATLDLLGAIFP